MLLINIILALFVQLNFAEDILVTTPLGTLRGRKEYSLRKNVSFYSFLEIPFAKPPLGELRFKEPEPSGPWEGIFDATTLGQKVCLQIATWGNFSGQTEDCLYLNVYTPKFPSKNASYPVLFYIYGGGFNSGYSGFWSAGPHYIMESEVVVVTATYRVGPFGFLSTGDTVIPGNYGLKDQNLALQWVRDNIQYFGGNPEQVTIMGGSAGAASVTYHYLSEKSRGLFRGGIANSGSLLCPWSYQDQAKLLAYQLATNIEPSFNQNASTEELLAFLRSRTGDEIVKAAQKIPDTVGNEEIVQGFFWTPVIEPQHKNAFITEGMYTAVEQGRLAKLPLLIGINSEEALYRITDSYLLYNVKGYDANVSALVTRDMHINDPTVLEETGTEIRRIYTQGLLQDNLANAIRFYSDTSFTRPIIRTAFLQSKYSPVYFYQFSYEGKLGGSLPPLPGADRVQHSAEGNYVFCYGNSSNLDAYPALDVLTSERFRTLLINFVKYQNPTPQQIELLNNVTWPAFKPNDFKYLNINTTLTVETNPKNSTYPEWVKLFDERAVPPLITY
ncbi:unnamed protein product [Phyllotreta striolata]|uniref:Carboxylic ester hydrolase n=1 Tax=Phyllotreta striolata TaxID=444603 RepID=A0A9P0GSW5_PHYSR|nr:unnamed protein product [Phyllotreta striolata]